MSTTPAARLRALRRECEFEVADVAHLLGVTDTKIERFELGTAELTLTDICAILAAYGSDFEALFGPQIEEAKADVAARLAEYQPGHGDISERRRKSLDRLRHSLNRLHGGDC